MAVRIALFLLIGLGLAGIAATVAVGLHPAPAPVQIAAPQPAVIAKTQILTASRLVRAGTLLLPDDLASKPVPPEEVPAGAWTDSLDARAAIQGAMVRHQIEPGQPVMRDDVVRPGERGFLAAVLAPGTRAATIGVDAVSGTAGLIWPGDRVDVILTHKIDDPATPVGRRVAGETVIQNARVIAVDQHMVEGVAPNTALASAVARTVTIEVASKDAEKISVASTLGHLAVVVRSASEPQAPRDDRSIADATDSPVWSSDVSAAYRSPQHSPDAIVRLFTGAQANPVEYRY